VTETTSKFRRLEWAARGARVSASVTAG